MIFTKPPHIRSMIKTRYITVLFLVLACRASLAAQTYGDVLKRNFWNASTNVTGIRQDSLSRSYALIGGSYTGGGFKDPSDAADLWSAGIETASIRHLKNISFRGSFAFTQTEFYSMCGSMFIEPGFYPLDILEFTPGRKTRQDYAFDGGLSYDAGAHWRIGVDIDFKAANLAKRKDLRHSNLRLDLEVAPGVMCHYGKFAAGLSAIFSKNSESVNPEQVGTSETSYYAFLDKGMMYGAYGPWNGGALHLDESGVTGFPMREYGYGAALQAQYGGFFAEVKWIHSKGRAGEKENIWFRFPGDEVGITAGYGRNGHFARLALSRKSTETEETILEKVSENGVQTVRETGSNIIGIRQIWSVAPEYEYMADFWEIKAGAVLERTLNVSATMYPYLFSRQLSQWEAYVAGTLHPGRFDIGIELGYAGGNLSEESSLMDENSGVQTVPFRLEDWYKLQTEWLVSGRIRAGLNLRCNFKNGMYINAQASLLHGFGVKLLGGSNRVCAELGFGYNF